MIMRKREELPPNLQSLDRALAEPSAERRIEKLRDLEDAFGKVNNSKGVGRCEHEIALAQIVLRQYENAIHTFTNALELNIPNEAKGAFLFNRASTYDLMGLPEMARADYLAAKKIINPKYYRSVEYGLQTIGKNLDKQPTIISIDIS